MECFNCKLQYNETDRTPRLLIHCGHSICEKCTAELYRNNCIVCPECHFLNQVSSITNFPRNLALINFKKTSDLTIGAPKKTPDLGQECSKHNKNYEAFCEQDKCLLCITCILEDGHRKHQIESLENANATEQEKINKLMQNCKDLELQIIKLVTEINNNLTTLSDSGDKQLVEITKFYNEIRKIVNERESHLKQKIRDTMIKEQSRLNQKETQLQSQLKAIRQFFDELVLSQSLPVCKNLSLTSKRDEVAQQSLSQIDPFDFKIPFQDVNRENEISQLVKQIANQRSPVNNNNNTSSAGNYANPSSNNNIAIQISSHQYQDHKQVGVKSKSKNANAPNFIQKNTKNQYQNSKKPQAQQQQATPAQHKKNGNVPGHATLDQCMKQKPQNLTDQLKPDADTKIQNESYQQLQNKQNKNQIQDNLLPVSLIANQENQSETEKKTQDKYKRSQSPICGMSQTANNLLSKKMLNNYHEMRNVLKEKLNCDKSELVNQIDVSGNLSDNHLTSFKLQSTSLTQIRRDNDSGLQGKSQSQIIPQQKSSQKDKVLPAQMEGNHVFKDSLASNEEPKQEQMVYPNKVSHIKDVDFEVSTIYNQDKQDRDDSVKGDLNTFFLETGNKINTSLTEIGINKCDISSLYQQQLQSLNQFIFVIGGFIENPSYVIERYDIQNNRWDDFDTLKTNRAKFALSVLQSGSILIMGGKQEGVRVSLCEQYNVRTKELALAELQLSTPKSGFGVATKNDLIYVIGGNDGQNILNSVELYDFKLKKITQLPSMKERRDELAVAFGPDNKIYAIGGFGGSQNICLKSAERYDPYLEQWESIANLNVPRRALTAITLPDGIYSIGGFDGFNYLSSVEKYDEQLNEWVFVCSMNYQRCTLSSISTPDSQHIFVFGGFDNGPLSSVEKYSVLNDSWEIVEPMKYKRFMHSCAIISRQNL